MEPSHAAPATPAEEAPRFFPAGEDAGLLDDDDGDSPEPLIEFGRRAATPKEEKRGEAKAPAKPRRRRST